MTALQILVLVLAATVLPALFAWAVAGTRSAAREESAR